MGGVKASAFKSSPGKCRGALAISPCSLSRKVVGGQGKGEVGVLGWDRVTGLKEKGQGLVWGSERGVGPEERGHADGKRSSPLDSVIPSSLTHFEGRKEAYRGRGDHGKALGSGGHNPSGAVLSHPVPPTIRPTRFTV